MEEAKALFSPKDDVYAFGEWMRLEREIWQPSRRKRHRPCLFEFMPVENQVYSYPGIRENKAASGN
jgi:hypothetical protein